MSVDSSQGRRTEQKSAIRAALVEADRPLNVPEILAAAQLAVPALGVATVYRNLKALLAEGWLHTVELPGEPSRYEVAAKDHHHHFRCNGCDRVFDIDVCPSKLGRLAPRGFVVESHDLVVYGRCAQCEQAVS